MPDIGDRVFLITGTSRGIGLSLARHYLEEGAVVFGCSRSASSIHDPKYRHLTVDISRPEGVMELFKAIRGDGGRLDVLVNNAAINPAIAFAALTTPDTISAAFGVNVIAAMNVGREAVKLMSRRKWGRIINISSMAAKLEVRGESVYTATKAALNSYTMVLAKEVYGLGITVNGVAPSAIETDLSAKIDRVTLLDVLSRNAIPEMIEMADVANLVDFLISDLSRAVTGQVIYLGGV
jgi:Dehydrogenases with different specificities (related to short-chain alcohol dehydrogenases)